MTDTKGRCTAHLYIGDDYGDNSATMRCQLKHGHAGEHREAWREGRARVTWDDDQRNYKTDPIRYSDSATAKRT